MKKPLLITAIALILVGAILFTWALAALDFDFYKLSTERYETNTYEVRERFDNISIDVTTTQVKFALSEDGSCKIVCHETEKVKHSATVQDGTLVIDTVDTRRWYDHIGISFGGMKMTVYLPRSEYASLLIETDTGDVEIPRGFFFESISIDSSTADITCQACALKSIDINTDTGDIKLIDVKCEETNLESDTGDITFTRVVAAESLRAETSTGDVRFENSDAVFIVVETNTGDVTGTLRSNKEFICETDTGDIDVPKTTSGGLCEITTDTGDISIRIIS